MSKPCKLQMNNSGAWKDVTRFDAADEERTDDILALRIPVLKRT